MRVKEPIFHQLPRPLQLFLVFLFSVLFGWIILPMWAVQVTSHRFFEWKRKKFGPNQQWQEWYAWYPVSADTAHFESSIVWLEKVHRRRQWRTTTYKDINYDD